MATEAVSPGNERHDDNGHMRNIAVKYLGQMPFVSQPEDDPTATGFTACQRVIDHLSSQTSRKQFRHGCPKDLLISLTSKHLDCTIGPKGQTHALSIPLTHLRAAVAAVNSKFAVMTVDPTARADQKVYVFQFKTHKASNNGLLRALERQCAANKATDALPSAAARLPTRGASLDELGQGSGTPTSVMSSSLNSFVSPLTSMRESLPTRSMGSGASAPLQQRSQGWEPQGYTGSTNQAAAMAETADKLTKAEARIVELEKMVAEEKANASAAEVARLSSVLRWVSAEKQASELKTEMADMRAEMAGVAAEMAADMAQLKADAADEREEQILRELEKLKKSVDGLAALRLREAPTIASLRVPRMPASMPIGDAETDFGDDESEVGSPHPMPRGNGAVHRRTRELAKRSSSKLLEISKRHTALQSEDMARQDSMDTTYIRMAMTGSRKPSATMELSLDELRQLNKSELCDIVIAQREKILKASALESKYNKTLAELLDATNQNDQLGSRVADLEAENANQIQELEREKQLLADTIAGQRFPTHPHSPDTPAGPNDSTMQVAPQSAIPMPKLAQRAPLADETFRDLAVTDQDEEGEEEQCLTIQFAKGGSGLGFSIAGGTDDRVDADDVSVYVTNVVSGGAAANDGRLRVGDKIVRVNNIDFTAIQHDQAVKTLQGVQQSVTLVVMRLPMSEDADQTVLGETFMEIEFAKGATGLGFSIAGGTDQPVDDDDPGLYVTAVIDSGSAARDGRLRVGDQLVIVNGQNMDGLAHAEAVQILQRIEEKCTMTIARLPDAVLNQDTELGPVLPQAVEELFTIEFDKGTKGLGFSIAGGTDQPVDDGDPSIYVTHIIEGGSADEDKRLAVGDRLIEVNSQNVLNVTHDEAVRALLRNQTGVKMLVSRPPPAIEETLEIEFIKGMGGLGFSIAGGTDDVGEDEDPGIYVTQVLAGGSADRDGRLRVDDRITEVNHVNTEAVTHDEAVLLLQKNPDGVQMKVVRVFDPAFQPLEEEILDFEFEKGDCPGFGFSIAGGRDAPIEEGDSGIYITTVASEGAAGRDGRLKFSDKLLMVNGVDVQDVDHQTAVQALLLQPERVSLRVSRIPQTETTNGEMIVQIEIARGAEGLGFSIAGGVDDPVEEADHNVYVTNVIDGGAAACDGRLKLGDRLLYVNGQSLAGVGHAKAVGFLSSNPAGVQLTVSRLPFDSFQDSMLDATQPSLVQTQQ